MKRHTGLSKTELVTLHEKVAILFETNGQRYTSGRRAVVELLAKSNGPTDVATISRQLPEVPQSSAYRSLALMCDLNVVIRILGSDDNGYFELSEDLVGDHHHHALCQFCSKVVDIESSAKLEIALQEAARLAGKQSGFLIDAHRIDLVGTCKDCQ